MADRGVVFDFDGVLARSMHLHAEAYRRVLAPLGVELVDDDVFLKEGARSETLIRDLLGVKAEKLSDPEIRRLAEKKQDVYASLGPPRLYHGAADLVRCVRAGASKVGLVTGTRRENVERLLGDLRPLFDAVLAQDSYRQDKPHPEPYERSAQALGLSPDRCAAVENAPRGVQSARAAGFAFVVGLTTTVPPELLVEAGAHRVVATHLAAAEAVLAWLRSP